MTTRKGKADATAGASKTKPRARRGAAAMPAAAGGATAPAEPAAVVDAADAAAPQGDGNGAPAEPPPVRGDDDAAQGKQDGTEPAEAVTDGQAEGGAAPGADASQVGAAQRPADPTAETKSGDEPGHEVSDGDLAIVAADMIGQITQIVLMDHVSPVDRFNLLARAGNIGPVQLDPDHPDTAEIRAAAEFVRGSPTAPTEAITIHLRRAGFDLPAWDQTEPNIRAAHDAFKLMLTVLDAKLAALAPAPGPVDLPPYGDAAELLADQPGELTDQAV